jgi:hypothetical protein
MSVLDLIAAVRDAMDELETAPQGGVGADGPTLAEMDAHVKTTGGCWGDDASYHTAQRAWRLLEDGLDKYERNAPDQARLQPSPEAGCSEVQHCLDCKHVAKCSPDSPCDRCRWGGGKSDGPLQWQPNAGGEA